MDYPSEQSLILLMLKVFKDLYPGLQVIVDHSYGSGVYCRYQPLAIKIGLGRIRGRMKQLIEQGINIEVKGLDRTQFRRHFKDRDDLMGLLSSRKGKFRCYELADYVDHLVGPLDLSLDKVVDFELKPYPPGFVLNWGKFIARPRLFKMIQEYEEWGQILGIYDVGRLNQAIKERYDHLILLAEALHEKKIAFITDEIISKRKKLILIAGPSASGKTTFSKRLAIQLQASKIRPVTLSIDDYFLDRRSTPRAKDGSQNFEGLEAINIDSLNRDLRLLLAGESVPIPKFNFQSGKPGYRGRVERLGDSGILILEGIHGLNDQLTHTIDQSVKFKIYASAITQLNIDDHNRIHTRDTRLLRRMVRDAQFRSHPATETIETWPKVTSGEDQNIFPFQEAADVMFNSALVYELPVLAGFARPLLKIIKRSESAYREAKRLYDLLSYFNPGPPDLVPNNSILREFIGGSIFCY